MGFAKRTHWGRFLGTSSHFGLRKVSAITHSRILNLRKSLINNVL